MSQPLLIERTCNVPAELLWHALTDSQAMKQWFFDLPDFKAQVGYEFRFLGGRDEAHQYLHICVVTEVIEARKLTYSWRYDGYEGISYVTFELFPEGAHLTRLKFTHAGLETFPSDNADLAKENFIDGWIHITRVLIETAELLQKQRTA